MKKSMLVISMFIVLSTLCANILTLGQNNFQSENCPQTRDEIELNFDGENNDGIGTNSENTFICAARFTADELVNYEGATIQTIKFWVGSTASSVTAKVFTGSSSSAPTEEILSEEIENFNTNEWTVYELQNYITIDTANEYWIGYEVVDSGGYPAGVDSGPAVNDKGCKMFFDGSWTNLYNLNSSLDYNWNIRMVIETQAYEHDVKVSSINNIEGNIEDETITPNVTIKNVGLNNETFDVNLTVFNNDIAVFEESVNIVDLVPGDNFDVDFPIFTPEAGKIYNVIVSTNLASDENPSNNEKTATFTTFFTEREHVILEIATGTWCQYCPGAAMGAVDLVENGHNVAVIEYHNQDNYVTTSGTARIAYYPVSGFPTSIFDGIEIVNGGSHENSLYPLYLPTYEERKAIKTSIELDVLVSSTLATLTITKTGEMDVSNLRAHVAITESEISENWQGQTLLDFVERAMFPSASGTTFTFDETGVTVLEIPIELSNSWELEHCELVAFVQDNETREIFQGTKRIFELQTGILTGTVTDFETGLPLEDVLVSSGATVSTDANGNYSIEIIEGEAVVTCEKDDYQIFTTNVTIISDNVNTLDIQLIPVTGNDNQSSAVATTKLIGNYPNPFNPQTEIKFSLSEDSFVSVDVYNTKGQKIKSLLSEMRNAGLQSVNWNGTDDSGKKVGSGIYLYKLINKNKSYSQKMILLK